MVLGHGSATDQIRTVAALFPGRDAAKDALVQDFHSTRQALNVASADQRILVLVGGTANELEPLRESLRSVCNDEEVIGRFHFDFEENNDWKKKIRDATDDSGIYLIRPGEFGMDGKVMKHLPLDTANDEIIRTLVSANSDFARSTKKKVYSEHVSKGRQLGIYFEGNVPYGEDRDGDGQIDSGGGGRSSGSRSRLSGGLRRGR